MALFQIAEPNQTPEPHQAQCAIGIDLGTTHSLVASTKNALTVCLKDENDQTLLPSVVHYAKDQITVGKNAQQFAISDPQNTIISVKRLMGRHLNDIPNAQKMPYHFVDSPQILRLKTAQGEKTPIEVSSEILKTLKKRAEEHLKEKIVGAVITVPAYFDEAQRQATKDAAKLAGLNVLRLINEPTAAAIAYGLDNQSEGVFAVYDLGGGTFDISILRLSKGLFEVLSTGGNTALGGDDFDAALAHFFEKEWIALPRNAENFRALLSYAKTIKERLSFEKNVALSVEINGFSKDFAISQELLAELGKPLIEQTLAAVKRALRDAHLKIADINGIVLVGGATRMPSVQNAVAEFFKQKPLTNLNPDEVVALGAAKQANILAGNRTEADDWLLLDVTALSLGLETYGGLVEKIIPRNSTIPTARAQDFTTFKDGQTAMAIHVVQGERDLVENCRSLARFELRGIPPMNAGVARIRVTFQVDADGQLSVSAREETSGVAAQIEVKPAYGLKEEEIAQILQKSTENAKKDAQVRSLREAQVEAERLIEATISALKADAALLQPKEKSAIKDALTALQKVLKSDDKASIHQKMDQLSFLTENFASLRMNKSIQTALSGKNINDFTLPNLPK